MEIEIFIPGKLTVVVQLQHNKCEFCNFPIKQFLNKITVCLLTCCSSSLLPLRSDRSEPGAFGYILQGVDGSLEYDPPDDVDMDRAGLLIDCAKLDTKPTPLSTGLRGDEGIE